MNGMITCQGVDALSWNIQIFSPHPALLRCFLKHWVEAVLGEDVPGGG